MPAATPSSPPRVCGATSRLPERLVLAALRLAPEPYGEPEDGRVERRPRCLREAHTGGDHYALVREPDGVRTTAVWTHWTDGNRPETVEALPACPAFMTRHSGSEACTAFLGHPGAHTWELHPAANGP